MKKVVIRTAMLGCICLPLFSLNNKLEAKAATICFYKEEPIAGVAVALDSYYAHNTNPAEGLAAYLIPLKLDILEAAPEPEPSPYENVAISNVNNYVNIRSTPDTEGEIVGKIYNNSAATILETVEGEDGEWYQIKSGSVTGYMKAEFFLTGEEAEAVAKQVGTVVATVVNTATLRLREAPSLDAVTVTLLAEDSEYIVLSEEDEEFVKIAVDNDLEGYVSKEYVDIRVDFEKAISIEEEQAKLEEEARLKREAEEAIKKAEEAKAAAKKAAAKKAADAAAKSSSSSQTTAAPETSATQAPSAESSAETSATRSAIVAYAKQFLGNPYVYGGTSLTSGTDCSGFTSSIYSHFGIGIGRSSRDQAAKGRTISVDSVQPGDLVFYASGGSINHVAMSIGGGQVIHASSSKTGIIISNMYYRTPYKAASFLN